MSFSLPCYAVGSTVAAPVEQLHAVLIEIMKSAKTASFRQRYDRLAPVVDQAFDLRTILERSVGPRWAALSPDERRALEDAFRRYTVSTYVSNFDDFSGQRFETLPNATAAGGDQVVGTKIIASSGKTHELDYVMRQAGGSWKIVDVLADGSISRVAVQRSEIRSVLATGGGPALLASLQKKVAELSGGQLR
jgi:phospholipid transport system substrate-binding protein